MIKSGRKMYSSMLLMVACLSMSMSISLSSAQLPSPSFGLPPRIPSQEIQRCWASLRDINGCVEEVYSSFIHGTIGKLGPACCKAIREINDKCWPKMFPFNPFFPPTLKGYCAKKHTGEGDSTFKAAAPERIESTTLDSKSEPNIAQCISSLQGCLQEVIASSFSFQFGLLGPACCKAVTTINDSCWPKILPFNPFFPPTVKDYCKLVAKAPPPPSSDSKLAHSILQN